ncbi:MAG: tRNA-specific adenosine deaminase, partial [Moorea sp. SIO1G6]|nr:tRNA-specific adenosine deaminase [Moorena sp. SIO1G6]
MEVPNPIDNSYLIHRKWMTVAIEIAQKAGEAGEVPVGAVIVDSEGKLIATGENRR